MALDPLAIPGQAPAQRPGPPGRGAALGLFPVIATMEMSVLALTNLHGSPNPTHPHSVTLSLSTTHPQHQRSSPMPPPSREPTLSWTDPERGPTSSPLANAAANACNLCYNPFCEP